MAYAVAWLNSLRQEGDPAADQLIAEIAGDGQVEQINAVLQHLITNSQPVPNQLPLAVRHWLERTERVPGWADDRRIRRAGRIFVRHGLAVSLVLAAAALVECYACRRGVKVLTTTYRLAQDPYRRVAETSQFIIDVLGPGGLAAGGRGIRAIQKVRLMHAGIRCLIAHTGTWPEQQLGVPICQEDLVGTLMSFSYLVIANLRKLGAPLTAREAEDYLYLWRAVGEMLGIRPEVMPGSVSEAAALTEAILTLEQGPTEDGVYMTRALLQMYRHLLPAPLGGLFPLLVRELVGDQVADWLQVPRSRWQWLVGRRALGRLLNQRLVNWLGVAVLRHEAIVLAGYRWAPFAIPTQLRRAWGLDRRPARNARRARTTPSS